MTQSEQAENIVKAFNKFKTALEKSALEVGITEEKAIEFVNAMGKNYIP